MAMNPSVQRTIVLYWLYVTSLNFRAAQTQTDPCVSYREVDDNTMLTSYQQTSTCKGQISQIGWTRFVTTDTGLIATSCPSGTQCGCGQQMWIDDTLPSCGDNITKVVVCIRGQTNCCERRNTIEIKMCNGFMVFNYVPLPPSIVICFANDSVPLPLPACSTTTPTTPYVSGVSRGTILDVTPVSVKRDDPDKKTLTFEGILLGFSVGLVAGLATSIAVYLYRKRKNVHSIRNKTEDMYLHGGQRSDKVAKPKFNKNRWCEE